MYRFLTKIVSGGQTGADRAALDWAIEHGIPHGGWCPKGRMAEDGAIEIRYHLTETSSAGYIQRTGWSVRDSDGTVIFTIAEKLLGGSKRTKELAQKHHKPCLHLSKALYDQAAGAPGLLDFVQKHWIKVLNVAGPRASKEPEVADFVKAVLEQALAA